MNAPTSPSAAATTEPPAWRRGFWCLMVTQFQGAFSDQVLKQLVVFLVLAMNLQKERVEELVSLSGMLFALPFILFTMLGGWLADRFSKRTVMTCVKTAEVAIMLFATWALASQRIPLQMTAICLMGVHSAIFGPSKYGILPELLPERRLSWGNGLLEAFTFLAIILGMLLAGYLAETFARNQAHSGYVLIGLALCGLTASRGITKVAAADPRQRFKPNFIAEFWRQMAEMKGHRDLWRANWGNAAFFYVATLVQMNLVLHANLIYHLGPKDNAGLLAALCLGIGGGSALAGYLSRGRIEIRVDPGRRGADDGDRGGPRLAGDRPRAVHGGAHSVRHRRRPVHRADRRRAATRAAAREEGHRAGHRRPAVVDRDRARLADPGFPRQQAAVDAAAGLLVLRRRRRGRGRVRRADPAARPARDARPLVRPEEEPAGE